MSPGKSTVAASRRASGAMFVRMALPGLLGALLLWLGSVHGIGVGYDSWFYLSAADNLAQGIGLGRFNPEGIWIPLTHFPPLYPTLLAASSWLLRAAPVNAARLLAAALFGLNASLAGAWIWRDTRSWIWSLIGAGSVLATPALLEAHLWAMTEPLYYLLTLLALSSLLWAGRSRSSKRYALPGLLTGLAIVTRYVGAAVALSCMALILWRVWRRETRLAGIGFYGLTAALAPASVLVRNVVVGGGAVNRTLLFHPPTGAQLREGLATLAGWTPAPFLPPLVRLAVVASVAAAALLVALRISRKNGTDSPTTILLLYAAAYTVVLLLSLTFFDASTRLRDRIMSPFLFAGLLLVCFAAASWSEDRAQTAGWAPVAVAGLWLVASAILSLQLLGNAAQNGLGFNSRDWRESETLAAARAIDSGVLIYSNEAIPMSYHLGRVVHAVPEAVDPVRAAVRENTAEELRLMQARLIALDGMLVLFHPEALRIEMPSLEQIIDGLQPERNLSDGAIYAAGGQ